MAHEGHDHGSSSGAVHEHKSAAPAQVACYVLTASDSRTPDTDDSGKIIREMLSAAGHPVAGYGIVKDDPEAIRRAIVDVAAQAGARAVIITGGTGIGRRDATFEVVQALLDKPLPGFGELFRMLSFQEIGSAAMMSRAVAGAARGMILFALPGSPAGVKLAMARLILPELGHAVREMTR